MSLLYTLSIYLFGGLMHVVALFHAKARAWVTGRRGEWERLATFCATSDTTRPLVWFHASSLGEFEQGRPLIEAFRAAHPHYRILLTFFSPSGYRIQRGYKGVDYVGYLPLDTPRNAARFVRLTAPQLAFFIKYEFWYNLLSALHRAGVKSYLVSAIFRPDQIFFKPWGGVMRRALSCFDHLFVQQPSSEELLQRILPAERVSAVGDTRFDRVYALSKAPVPLPLIAAFTADRTTLVAGSTWPADEALLVELMQRYPQYPVIVAPHEIDTHRLLELASASGRKAILYSELQAGATPPATADLLLIDCIGVLSSIYQYGTWGYIGGGFGAGIHNTLEAAAFGLPIAFGPNYRKFAEAHELLAGGGAESVTTTEELCGWMETHAVGSEHYKEASTFCHDYIQQRGGATERILSHLTECGILAKR